MFLASVLARQSYIQFIVTVLSKSTVKYKIVLLEIFCFDLELLEHPDQDRSDLIQCLFVVVGGVLAVNGVVAVTSLMLLI